MRVWSSGLGCKQNWKDGRMVAGCVEILEIEPVVPSLIAVGPGESLFTDLELNWNDCAAANYNRIDARTKARNFELECDPTLNAGERFAKN